MKKQIIYSLISFCSVTLIVGNVNGQSSSTGFATGSPNLPNAGNDFIGWAAGSSTSLTLPQLDIKNEDNMPIMFYTDAGAATYNNLRMIIYEDPTTPGVYNAGFVGIGYAVPPRHLTIVNAISGASLLGTTPSMIELLVAGGIENNNTGWQTVADFQSSWDNSNSIGIRIRGSRNSNQNSDCGFIDFHNFYKSGECDFPLARISADVRGFGCDDAKGYYRLKIADGTVTGGFNLAMFADHNGQVGIGLPFDHTANIFPGTRLEILDVRTAAAQFRITQDYNVYYTDFQTYSDGNLLINPIDFSSGTAVSKNVGIGLSTSNTPTEMIDVSGNGRIRGLNTGTNNYLVTAETNGTLHKLGMSTAGNVLHGDGSWSPVGAGTVTSCSGGGGTANFITKFLSGNDICNSSIWENDFGATANRNVGVHNFYNNPLYGFHNEGTAMFTRYSISTALPTSLYYPLAIQSFTGPGFGGPSGLGIYSNLSGVGANDELNLYADDNGVTHFRFLNHDVNFHSVSSSRSYMGFAYNDDAVIMKNDFTTVPSLPSGAYAKLYVEAQDGSSPDMDYAIWAKNTITNYSAGFKPTAIRAESIQANATGSYDKNIGVWSSALDAEDENIGISSEASGGLLNFGVYSKTLNPTTSNNYAIYGVTVTNANSCTGTTSTSCTNAAGYFDGDVFTTIGAFIVSDSTLKKNIQPLQNSLQLLSLIHSYTYDFDTSKTHGMNVPEGNQYGLLSQEIYNVLPQLVKNVTHPENRDSLGNIIDPAIHYLSLNYSGLIPLLLSGINEEKKIIDSLNIRLTNLEAIVNNCCNPVSKPTGQNFDRKIQSIELKNITTIFLDQNKPNPFADQTDIDYYLPEEVKNAEMVFFDAAGQQIKSVSLKERGKGTLHIYSPELKSGSYRYSLIADGMVIETKTMVKSK